MGACEAIPAPTERGNMSVEFIGRQEIVEGDDCALRMVGRAVALMAKGVPSDTIIDAIELSENNRALANHLALLERYVAKSDEGRK